MKLLTLVFLLDFVFAAPHAGIDCGATATLSPTTHTILLPTQTITIGNTSVISPVIGSPTAVAVASPSSQAHYAPGSGKPNDSDGASSDGEQGARKPTSAGHQAGNTMPAGANTPGGNEFPAGNILPTANPAPANSSAPDGGIIPLSSAPAPATTASKPSGKPSPTTVTTSGAMPQRYGWLFGTIEIGLGMLALCWAGFLI